MSFVKIDSQNFELMSLLLKPSVHFVSSSIGGGVTGSNYVAPFRSKCIKQVIDLSTATTNLTDGDISQFDTDNFWRAATLEVAQASTNTNINASLLAYLSLIDDAPKDVRFSKTMDMFRFDPPVKYTKNSTVKNVIRNILMPHHIHRYDNCGFWYTNYNSLNFLSNSDKLLTGSCLLYPNVAGSYDLPDTFTTNFWINPRYSKSDTDYSAGTIFHISSSICVSLVSGSDVNSKGEEDSFKILLQLSQSADKPPSSINLNSPSGAYPNNLIFTSSHSLRKNNWHNVTIMWGNSNNNSSGSIFIDDKETNFHIPSSSLSSTSSPAGLVIGNYFDGNDTTLGSFLGTHVASEGVSVINYGLSADYAMTDKTFSHPLHAEVHDIRMHNTYRDRAIIKNRDARYTAPTEITDDLVFYVPPYFYPDTPEREVLLTPFQYSTSNTTTNDPFNVSYSFGVGGKMINLENYVREFVKGEYPRLFNLRPKTINVTIQDITADQYTYELTGSASQNVTRNFTILPCDNGLHTPKYDLLKNSPLSSSDMFKKSNNISDYSIINLDRLVPTASLYPGLVFTAGSIFDAIVGSSPDNPGVAPGSVLTIAQRTRDVSSNEITVFDISNIYYGNKIHPGSFKIHDDNLTGSNGDIKITLRDNGRGSLYRADALTKHAEFNSVGTLLYDEGIAVIKSPNLLYFCKDKSDISFKGEQNIHTMIINVPCYEWAFTSSSNSTFTKINPTTGANDEDVSSIYITSVNIHDDNLNIIMKANLAQPIIKADDDEFVIRLKQDF